MIESTTPADLMFMGLFCAAPNKPIQDLTDSSSKLQHLGASVSGRKAQSNRKFELGFTFRLRPKRPHDVMTVSASGLLVPFRDLRRDAYGRASELRRQPEHFFPRE
jgi:hypothetical protein